MGQHEAMHFRKVKENVGEFGNPLFWAFGHRYAGSSLLICFAEWICMPRPAWEKKENPQEALDVPKLQPVKHLSDVTRKSMHASRAKMSRAPTPAAIFEVLRWSLMAYLRGLRVPKV